MKYLHVVMVTRYIWDYRLKKNYFNIHDTKHLAQLSKHRDRLDERKILSSLVVFLRILFQ